MKGQAMLKSRSFSAGSGKYQINAVAVTCGDDLVVTVGGGTHPHIGAIAMAMNYPSLKNPDRLTTTGSLLGLPGHKEDLIAREAAFKLSRSLGTTVTVCAGIHIDDASQDDIEHLVEIFNALIDQITTAFSMHLSLQADETG